MAEDTDFQPGQLGFSTRGSQPAGGEAFDLEVNDPAPTVSPAPPGGVGLAPRATKSEPPDRAAIREQARSDLDQAAAERYQEDYREGRAVNPRGPMFQPRSLNRGRDKPTYTEADYSEAETAAVQRATVQTRAQQQQADADRQRSNDARIAQMQAAGQRYYHDSSGVVQPLQEPRTGRYLYNETPWEESTNPQTGETALRKVDRYGQQQFKTPSIVTSPDLEDQQLYYRMPNGDMKPAGAIDELVNHKNPTIARAAITAVRARTKAMWDDAIRPVQAEADEAHVKLDQAKLRAMDLRKQSDALQSQIDSLQRNPTLTETTGGLLGIVGASETPAAKAIRAKLEDLQNQQSILNDEESKLTEQTKTDGELSRAALEKDLRVRLFKAQGGHAKYTSVEDERRAILRQQGKSEQGDPILASIQAAKQAHADFLAQHGQEPQAVPGGLSRYAIAKSTGERLPVGQRVAGIENGKVLPPDQGKLGLYEGAGNQKSPYTLRDDQAVDRLKATDTALAFQDAQSRLQPGIDLANTAISGISALEQSQREKAQKAAATGSLIGEPAELAAQGVKSIGGVDIDQIAKRYGADAKSGTPASLMRIRQRIADIDQTLGFTGRASSALNEGSLKGYPTSLDPKVRESLGQERQYLDQLYKHRYAGLAPAAQASIDRFIKANEPTSTAGAVGRTVATQAAPTAGVVAGFEFGASLGAKIKGPPIVQATAPLVGGTLGAIAGGWLAQKAQEKTLETVAPETANELRRLQALDQQYHPIATEAANLGLAAAAFKPNPKQVVTGLTGISKLIRGAKATDLEMTAVKHLAASMGIGTAMGIVDPLTHGEKPTPTSVLQSAAMMMFFGQSRVGVKAMVDFLDSKFPQLFWKQAGMTAEQFARVYPDAVREVARGKGTPEQVDMVQRVNAAAKAAGVKVGDLARGRQLASMFTSSPRWTQKVLPGDVERSFPAVDASGKPTTKTEVFPGLKPKSRPGVEVKFQKAPGQPEEAPKSAARQPAPESAAPQEEASGERKALPGPKTEPTAKSDYDRYQEIQSRISELTKQGKTFDDPEIKTLWAENEAIKNRNAKNPGMPPEKPALEETPTQTKAGEVQGEPINEKWTAFSDESKGLGVPRAEMPQIKAEARGALTQFLAARGIEHETTEIKPTELKPTQAEYSPEKVEKARKFEGGDRSIIISSDNHVVDGHHQWMAALADRPTEPMKVIRLNKPIRELLPQVREFPSAQAAAGATGGQPNAIQKQGTGANDVRATPENREEVGGRNPVDQGAAGEGQGKVGAREGGESGSRAPRGPEPGPRGEGKPESPAAAPVPEKVKPAIERGRNHPLKLVKTALDVAGATGEAHARTREALTEFAKRVHAAAPEAFQQMEVHVLTPEQWKANKKLSARTPDSAAAYSPESNTLYLHKGKLTPDNVVSAIVHEAGHFAEQYFLGTDFTQAEWEKLTPDQRVAAYQEYTGNALEAGGSGDLTKNVRARREWVAMQFARVVRGETKGMSERMKLALTRLLEALRAMVRKWIGSEKLTTKDLDRRILEMMGYAEKEAPPSAPPAAEPKSAPAKGDRKPSKEMDDLANDLFGTPSEKESDDYTKRFPPEKNDKAIQFVNRILTEFPDVTSKATLAKFLSENYPQARPFSQSLFNILSGFRDMDPSGTFSEHYTPAEKLTPFMQVAQRVEGRLREALKGGQPLARSELAKMSVDLNMNAKDIDEAAELAVTRLAREIAAREAPAPERFADMLKLYEAQPNLTSKTSTSKVNQAYSTPAPIAFVASQLAKITHATTVIEPTAGNGMLLIEADPAKVQANEINQVRKENLESQGFKVTQKDAAMPSYNEGLKPADRIIANPPFGAVMNNGKAMRFPMYLPNAPHVETSSIDKAIVMNTLKNLKPDGRAVLIIGSGRGKALDPKESADAYIAGQNQPFFHSLYTNFNVVDHFTVSGDLYAKQGAGWPIDVIVIDGKGKSGLPFPWTEAPYVVTQWNELADKLTDRGRLAGSRPAPGGEAPVRGPEGRPERPAEPVSGGDQRPGQPRAPRAGVPGRAGTSEPPVERPRGAESPAQPERTGETGVEPAGRGEPPRDGLPGGEAGPRPDVAPAKSRPVELNETGMQATYRPASKSPVGMKTLTPKNLVSPIERALADVEARRGPLDDFVQKELGYPTKEDLFKALDGVQVDAVALAIDNVLRGGALINGDQTGVGKGRTVAAMGIRWAVRNGYTPIFITKNPALYADMLRDLDAIGSGNIVPFLTDAAQTVNFEDANGNLLKQVKTPIRAKHMKQIQHAIETGKLPGGAKVIFTSYDQIKSDVPKGFKESPRDARARKKDRLPRPDGQRMQFLRQFARNGFVVMDESHLAGGESDTGWRVIQMITGRNATNAELGAAAQPVGVYYTSATYAKRPENMGVYFNTNVKRAVASPKELSEIMEAGGVPLQQVLSAMLAHDGQYIRRELDFTGVNFVSRHTHIGKDGQVRPEVEQRERRLADSYTEPLREILDFNKSVLKMLEDLNGALREEGIVMEDGKVLADELSGTNFGDHIHNMVKQYLYAIKAEGIADSAVEALKAGKSPVIAVHNTMDSVLNDLHAGGYKMNFDGMLERYLDKALEITLKKPDGTKQKIKIDLEDLRRTFPNIQQIPRRVFDIAQRLQRERDVIRDLIHETDRSQIPTSPIDYIKHRIEDAGFTFHEISGRQHMLDRNGAVTQRPSLDASKPGQNKILAKFNRDPKSALLITLSGTTGISAHSSKEFKNQQPRVMITGQIVPDVNDFVQMLGRIFRKGQVHNPEYINLLSSIPAEQRLQAILSVHLKSLNANTTSDAEGITTSSAGGIDFMNQYGDQVAHDYLSGHPETVAMLQHNFPTGELPSMETLHEGGVSHGDFVRKVSGEVAVLPVDEQERFYEHLLSEYKSLIEYLDSVGENKLRAQNLKLDAETLEKRTIFNGTGNSIFDGPAHLETLKVTSQRKPLPAEDLPKLAGEKSDAVDKNYRTWDSASRDQIAKNQVSLAEKHSGSPDWEDIRVQHSMRDLEARNTIGKGFSLFNRPVIYTTEDGTNIGFVTDVRYDPDKPLTPSAQKLVIHVNTEQQHVTLPMSQLKKVDTFSGPDWMSNYTNLSNLSTVKRVITGNLIGGASAIKNLGGEGRVITYTTKDGQVLTGMLMPKSFNPQKAMQPVPTGLRLLAALREGNSVSTPGGAELSLNHGNIEVSVPASKVAGGRYWQDRRLTDLMIGGEMQQRSDRMFGLVPDDRAEQLANFFNGALSDPLSYFEATKKEDDDGPVGTPALTSSKEFTDWFGDSKVVDEKGEPLVVYHGTDGEFHSFDFSRVGNPEEGGPFFTDNSDIARDYGHRLVEAYLKIEKPYELTYRQWLNETGPSVDKLKRRGYDGFIVRDFNSNGRAERGGDEMGDVGDVFVPFSDPTQIKSAIGNRGTFDPNDPDIYGTPGEKEEPRAFVDRIKDGLSELKNEITAAPSYSGFNRVLNTWVGNRQIGIGQALRTAERVMRDVPDPKRREAITNWLDAGGDVNTLNQWAQATEDKGLRAGYEAAANLTPAELEIARKSQGWFKAQFERATRNGVMKDSAYRENYVTHLVNRPYVGGGPSSPFSGKVVGKFKYSMQRTFPNFHEMEQAGYRARTKDLAQIMAVYGTHLTNAIETRRLAKSLLTEKNARGESLGRLILGRLTQDDVGEANFVNDPAVTYEDGIPYSPIGHSAFRGWGWSGKSPESGKPVIMQGEIGVHPEIAQQMKNAIGRSAIRQWFDSPSRLPLRLVKGALKFADQTNQTIKGTMLGGVSTFHAVHELKRAAGNRVFVNPFGPGTNWDDAQTQFAVRHGLMLGGDRDAENLFSEGLGNRSLVDMIPGIGRVSRAVSNWTFHQLIPSLKINAFNALYERNQKLFGREASPDDVAYLTAQQVNARFGHLNLADLNRNPTLQHVASMLALAPDFLESNARNYAQVLRGATGAKAGRQPFLAFLTTVAAVWAAARVLNQLLDDDPHYDEPFGVIHNGRRYTMRNEAEDLWRLIHKPESFLLGRASPAMGSTIEGLTQRNWRGEKVTRLDVLKEFFSKAAPISFRWLPLLKSIMRTNATGANITVSPFQEFLGSQGIQVGRVSPVNDVYELSQHYRDKIGEPEDTGTYPVSKYQQLRYALEDHDIPRAREELEKLIELHGLDPERPNMTPGQQRQRGRERVHRGFEDSLFRPWTKNSAMDKAFIKSLNPQDRAKVLRAEAFRESLWKQFSALVGMPYTRHSNR